MIKIEETQKEKKNRDCRLEGLSVNYNSLVWEFKVSE